MVRMRNLAVIIGAADIRISRWESFNMRNVMEYLELGNETDKRSKLAMDPIRIIRRDL